jgi:hypothetical protein
MLAEIRSNIAAGMDERGRDELVEHCNMMCRIAVETLPEDLYAQPDACAYAAASRRGAYFGAAGRNHAA